MKTEKEEVAEPMKKVYIKSLFFGMET